VIQGDSRAGPRRVRFGGPRRYLDGMAAGPAIGEGAGRRTGPWLVAAAALNVLAVVAFGALITAVSLGLYLEPDQIAPLLLAGFWLLPAAGALACAVMDLRAAARAGTPPSAAARATLAVTLVMCALGLLLLVFALLLMGGDGFGR
jgi:hypothetical protein